MQWLLCFQTAFSRVGPSEQGGYCFSVWRFGRACLFACAGSDGLERINMPSDCQLLPFVVKMGYVRSCNGKYSIRFLKKGVNDVCIY
ncbi:MAG: hypothetical protein ACFNKE_07740, partial [Neisseria elongata]